VPPSLSLFKNFLLSLLYLELDNASLFEHEQLQSDCSQLDSWQEAEELEEKDESEIQHKRSALLSRIYFFMLEITMFFNPSFYF